MQANKTWRVTLRLPKEVYDKVFRLTTALSMEAGQRVSQNAILVKMISLGLKATEKGSAEMMLTKLGLCELAKRSATLRDFLTLFYGEELEATLALEPEAEPDLDAPVTEIWECRERMGGRSHALHAGSTIWVDTPSSHLVSNDDDLSEYEDPAQGWQRVYPE